MSAEIKMRHVMIALSHNGKGKQKEPTAVADSLDVKLRIRY